MTTTKFGDKIFYQVWQILGQKIKNYGLFWCSDLQLYKVGAKFYDLKSRFLLYEKYANFILVVTIWGKPLKNNLACYLIGRLYIVTLNRKRQLLIYITNTYTYVIMHNFHVATKQKILIYWFFLKKCIEIGGVVVIVCCSNSN